MAESERKKAYEIKEEVLDILMYIDDKSIEGMELREGRDRYFSTLHNVNQYGDDLTNILDLLETESVRTKSLHGKLAVNEKEIAALKSEIPLLKKEWEEIENPGRVIEEFEKQELLLADLAEKETASEKDIARTEQQMREDLKTADTAAEELKTIVPEIEQKTPQKTALTEEVGRLEKSAKIFVEKDRLESAFEEHEDEFNARSSALNKLEETISECDESIPELKDAIKNLQDSIGPLEEAAKEVAGLLEERTAVQADIEGIEPEHAAINQNVEELQGELNTINGVLNELEQENSDMKESITSIEEAIERSSNAVMEIKMAKGKLKESTASNEQTITKLEKQLSEKTLMDKDLSIMEETMKTIAESVEAKA